MLNGTFPKSEIDISEGIVYEVDFLPQDENYKRGAIINGKRYSQFNSSARWAYTVDDVVIKIDSNYSHSQSRREAWFWDVIKNHPDCKYFAQVVASGLTVSGKHFWVAQKKYEFESGQVAESITDLVREIVNRWKIVDIYSNVHTIYDNLKDINNWGLVNQLPLIFDYGLVDITTLQKELGLSDEELKGLTN